jgi:hypothetical protein
MTTSANGKGEAKGLPRWMEWLKAWIEVLGVIAIAGTLWLTYQDVQAATAAAEASNEQIYEARFETSYQHYLDLWTVAAENPKLAPYIVGGDKPNERLDKGEAEKDAIRAAVIKSLDVTLYAFNRAPRIDGKLPPGVLNPNAPPPAGINEQEWKDWQTWASSIISAFEDSPGMCPLLSGEKNRRIYGSDFQDAVPTRCRTV